MLDQMIVLVGVRKINEEKVHLNHGRYSLSQCMAGCQFQIQDQPHIIVAILFFIHVIL